MLGRLLGPRSLHSGPAMDLKQVISHLEALAPLSLSESWDNTGLLVEPSAPRPCASILLTNDLTEPVVEEAVALGTDLIVSYHPPVFRPLKRVAQGSWKERVVVRCLEERMAVYSPHTSWDAVQGGINDWLVRPYGEGAVAPLALATAPSHPGGCSHTVTIAGAPVTTDQLQPLLALPNISVSVDPMAVSVSCPQASLAAVVAALPPDLADLARVTKHELPPLPGTGAGRRLVLEAPLPVEEMVARTKAHLGLPHLRLALANGATAESLVSSLAVCAGSGATVLAHAKADLVLTGEMSHHEVLDFVHKGTTVILTEHSNCERGYLVQVARRLEGALGEGVTINISKVDRDPLVVV